MFINIHLVNLYSALFASLSKFVMMILLANYHLISCIVMISTLIQIALLMDFQKNIIIHVTILFCFVLKDSKNYPLKRFTFNILDKEGSYMTFDLFMLVQQTTSSLLQSLFSTQTCNSLVNYINYIYSNLMVKDININSYFMQFFIFYEFMKHCHCLQGYKK